MKPAVMKYRLYDMLSVARDPFLLLFAVVPLLASTALRFIIPLASRLIMQYTGFNLMAYGSYITCVVCLLPPLMLGSMTAFMMLDEMDGGLVPVMRITPGSTGGYLIRRLLLPVIVSVLFIPLCHAITGFTTVSTGQMAALMILGALNASLFVFFVYSVAADKVAGLTLSKASGLLILPCFAPLFPSPWVLRAARMTPLYYASELLRSGLSVGMLSAALAVNILWVAVFLAMSLHKIKKCR